MPWPNPNESQEEFISRCMSSDESQKTFPDEKQRAAFCYSRYKEHKESKSLAEIRQFLKEHNIDDKE